MIKKRQKNNHKSVCSLTKGHIGSEHALFMRAEKITGKKDYLGMPV